MGSRTVIGPLMWLGVLGLTSMAHGQNWSNAGGNAGRNGVTAEFGPESAQELWSGGRSSIIAWQPVIDGSRAFMVRQTGFPPESNRSPVVAMDLDTGAELWATNIPANAGDWTAWVAGARDGRVYAGRSGNGASVSARLYCLDAATGAVVWQSAETISAGAYDGVVFADDGDLIVASMSWVRRIESTDGSTVWTTPRICSVSGNCGGALAADATGQAVYLADAAPGGHVIKKFDAESGAFLYQSPVMAGFTIQNTPLVGPDGTIYLNRVQNNAAVDYFYAFADTGSALVERWRVPSRYTYAAEFAATQDAVFVPFPDNSIRKLRATDGTELETTGVLDAPLGAVRMACDAGGNLFVSNGEFAQGRFSCFGSDLRERWSVAVPNINIGAPAIGRDGTLVVAGIGTNVRAYRTDRGCPADFNDDDFVDFFDYDAFVSCFEGAACPPGRTADFNGDDFVDFFDYDAFVELFQAGC